jgi:hypothetical protein
LADDRATARRYAVLALIGDTMNVVTYQPAVAGNTDRNRREAHPIPGGVFDRTALLAADEALRRQDPQADVILLAAPPLLYGQADKLADGSRLALPADLDAVLKAQAATHLVLIRKHRANARLQAERTMLGSGKLEGIGFYIDREKVMTRSDTGQRGEGFLGPYVYIRLALFDLATGVLVREEPVTGSTTVAASRSASDGDPWTALPDAQKVNVLRGLVAREVGRAVPKLVPDGSLPGVAPR